MIKLSERISYIKATESPLSADVGLIFGDRSLWLYDVGNNTEVTREILSIDMPKNAVLSHFHPDHTGGLLSVGAERVYLSVYTKKYIGLGETVIGDVYVSDGVKLHIFPLPSSHSKGALGLEAEGFAFLGDGTYTEKKGGRYVYNATLLKDMITRLKSLEATTFLLSHDPRYALPREEVILNLEKIYSRRKKEEAYIDAGE